MAEPTKSDYSVEGIIRYLEMAVRVMGFKNPVESSYEYHAAEMLKKLRDENAELQKKIEEIKSGFEGCCTACEPVGEMNKQLRKERDEARRNLCLSEAADLSFGEDGIPYHPSVAHKIAADHGWDCFKEEAHE